MAKKAFTDYAKYLSTASKRTFARAERFEVSFDVEALVQNNEMNGGRLAKRIGQGAASALMEPDISLFCEEVQIPGMILSNKEFNVGAWTFFRNTKVGFLGNEINFTFVTPNDWDLRGFFEQWIKECADTTSQELGYIDAVTTTIDIKCLDLNDFTPCRQITYLLSVRKTFLFACTILFFVFVFFVFERLIRT